MNLILTGQLTEPIVCAGCKKPSTYLAYLMGEDYVVTDVPGKGLCAICAGRRLAEVTLKRINKEVEDEFKNTGYP